MRRRDWNLEAKRQTALVELQKQRLCNPVSVDAAFVALAGINARVQLRQIQALIKAQKVA